MAAWLVVGQSLEHLLRILLIAESEGPPMPSSKVPIVPVLHAPLPQSSHPCAWYPHSPSLCHNPDMQ